MVPFASSKAVTRQFCGRCGTALPEADDGDGQAVIPHGPADGDPGIRMTLARLEHRRFVAERLLEGWLPLPAGLRGRGASGLPVSMQKSLLRLSHTLVPFDRLPEVDPDTDQQSKDLKVVDAIPEILGGEAMLGTSRPHVLRSSGPEN